MADSEPASAPGSPLPLRSVPVAFEETHVTGWAGAALVSLVLPAVAVMAPPGCTVQVCAVAAAKAAGSPRAATRTAAPPAVRMRAYLLPIALCLPAWPA